jgi:hypothetical protein
MTNFVKFLSVLFLLIGGITLVYFLNKASVDGYTISNSFSTNYEITGQFGDFIGGVVGTFFALTGTFLIYLTFQEQSKENKRARFESAFFEMIRLHRENVTEMRYRKFKLDDHVCYENRQVVRIIFQEFIECYREVKKFSNSKEISDYITPRYLENLNKIISNANSKINPIEMARIDIAYTIVFYGLSVEGESVIRRLFLKKYNPDYYYKLLYFLKLKPKRSNRERYENWEKARNLDLADLHKLVDGLYKNRKHPERKENMSQQAKDYKMELTYEKYYGGHQFRLGHYFRHLFQSFKYLNSNLFMNDEEKYFYGKMLRAQVSTYEQALLFVNSISSIGMKWELSPEIHENNKINTKLITKYNLIKNLPGYHMFGIKYKTYYKDVAYETDEHII